MSKDLLSSITEAVVATVVDRFIGPNPPPDAAPAPEASIEARETTPAPVSVTDVALGPQRFTCPCGCAYEVGIDVDARPSGVTRTFYVKPVGAAPATWRRRRAAKRRVKP